MSSEHPVSELNPVATERTSLNFRRDVFPYLQTISNGLKRKKKISKERIWNSLLIVIGLLNVNTENIVYCFRLLFEVCRILDEHQCTNIVLKSQILNLMLKLTEEDITGAVTATHNIYTFASTGEDRGYNRKVELCFISNPDLPKDVSDIVWEAARNFNVGLLKLFLKFGAEMVFPLHEVSDWEKLFGYLHVVLWDYAHISFRIRDAVFHSRSLPFPKKRVLLVKRALEIFVKMKRFPEHAEMYSKCYDLLFKSLPDPEVTSEEIKTLLQMLLPRIPAEDELLITRGLEELLPRTAQVIQPRCLQQLSCYQVRQNLRKSGNISHGVSSLNIPNLMKNYILLEDDGHHNLIVRTRVESSGLVNYSVPVSFIDIDSEHNDDYVLSVLKSI